MRTLLATVLACLSLSAPVAQAHEFWLEPEDWQVAAGAPIILSLRVGEGFKGASYIYNDHRFARFELLQAGEALPVPGVLGDDPAMTLPAPTDGLAIVVHETTDNTLTYREWDKFTAFVDHKAFAGALDAHAARGLPQTGFRETYRRYAKALIGVGGAAGTDRPVGLTTEIVLLNNPYTDDVSGGLPLQVLHDGTPRADAQVELFAKAPDGTVDITLHRTDGDGRVTVPVVSGHAYLADAVILQPTETDDPKAGPVWHSLWAATTFFVP